MQSPFSRFASTVVVIARGLRCTIRRGSGLNFYSDEDAWFALFGKLHMDPFRFLSLEEVFVAMESFLGRPVNVQERVHYSNSAFWDQLRAQNVVAVMPAEGVVEAVITMSQREYQNAIQASYRRGAAAMKKAMQVRIGAALRASVLYIGHNQAKNLVSHFNNAAVGVSEVAGIRVKPAKVNKQRLFAEAIEEERSPVPSHPLPSPLPRMLIGFESVPRDLVVTVYDVPLLISGAELTEKLTASGISIAKCLLKSRTPSSASFRILCSSKNDVTKLMESKIRAERKGKDIVLRKYPHFHDCNPDTGGRVFDALAVLRHLRSTYADLLGGKRSIVVYFADGVVPKQGLHLVQSSLSLIGKNSTPRQRLFSLTGTERESQRVNLVVGFVAQAASTASMYSCMAFVGDGLMHFESTNVHGGRSGWRSPYLLLHSQLHSVVFYAPIRTVQSMIDHAKAMLGYFQSLVEKGVEGADVCDTDLYNLGKVLKKNLTKGVMDVPACCQYDRVLDAWTNPDNKGAILLWQRAFDIHAPVGFEDFVWLNGRHAALVGEGNLVNLGALIPQGAEIEVLDEAQQVVKSPKPGFWGPVVVGSILFVSHRYYINPEHLIFVQGGLHGAALHMADQLLQAAVRWMKPGGCVFGKETRGMTQQTLVDTVVDPAVNCVLGGAKQSHRYTNGTSKLILFEEWNTVFGEISHVVFLPVMELWAQYLLARVTRDKTLCDDFIRYNRYHMLTVIGPLVVLAELAELRRRELESKACAKKYMKGRAGADGDLIALPIPISLTGVFSPDDGHVLDEIERAVNDQAAPEKINDLANKAKGMAKKAKASHDLTSIKLGGVACALPQSLHRLNHLSGLRLLMSSISEDRHEWDLKFIKALILRGNGKDHIHVMPDVAATMGSAQQAKNLASSAPVYTTLVAEVRFCPCWLHYLKVGAYNTCECLAMIIDLHLDELARVFSLELPDVPECAPVGLSFLVGDEGGKTLEFCATGKHKERLRAVPSADIVSLPRTSLGSQGILSKLRHDIQGKLPSLPAEKKTARSIVAEIAEKAKARKAAREAQEQQEEENRKVVALLQRLGFLQADDDNLTLDVLRDFRVDQLPQAFRVGTNKEWPQGRLKQITHLAQRVEEEWRHKKKTQHPQRKRK